MAIHKVDGVDGNNVYPRKFIKLQASDTSGTRGQSLMVDTADTTNGAGMSVKIADAEDSRLACGIADTTWSAAGPIRVQVAGWNDLATADSGAGITIGDNVGTGTGGGNGRIQTVAGWTDTVNPFALCVNAFTASTADGVILITDKGWFAAP